MVIWQKYQRGLSLSEHLQQMPAMWQRCISVFVMVTTSPAGHQRSRPTPANRASVVEARSTLISRWFTVAGGRSPCTRADKLETHSQLMQTGVAVKKLVSEKTASKSVMENVYPVREDRL
jgi:hypothetical protein